VAGGPRRLTGARAARRKPAGCSTGSSSCATAGRWREAHPLLYLFAALFVVRYAYLT